MALKKQVSKCVSRVTELPLSLNFLTLGHANTVFSSASLTPKEDVSTTRIFRKRKSSQLVSQTSKLNSVSTASTASTTNIQNRRKKSRKCLDTERDPTFSPEDLAEVPPLKRKFYGDCDDYDLCRRIFVKPTITLKALLQKIHDTYVQMP